MFPFVTLRQTSFSGFSETLSLSHYGGLASSVSCLFTPPCNKLFGVGGVGGQGMADTSNYQEDK